MTKSGTGEVDTILDGMNWRMQATCRQADPELFFPEYAAGPEIDQAKQICDGCPVRARCLDWALSNGASAGIWGGRTEAERHAMSTTAVTDQGPARGTYGGERLVKSVSWRRAA